MERIAIIGCSGSGKSTLARRLGKCLGLPVIHLDTEYWNPGWEETPQEAWRARVDDLVQGERWIIDGNYSSTMAARLAAADTVVYLDMPRWLCLWRVLKRWLTYAGRSRPDMPAGCTEKVDLAFLQWVWTYPTRSRPGTLRRLHALKNEKQIIWLRSPDAVEQFLQRLETGD